MTGILGIVRLMINTKLSKEQHDYAQAIQTSGDTMMALLNDILDFEKIESGNMMLEDIEFDFPRLVQDVITLMSGYAVDKNISLTANISDNFPASLIGDPTRLRQIILNLTSNAIKFTENGSVTLHLKATQLVEKQDGINADYEIYVGVEDTGIGIPEDVQTELFSPFSQADESVSRKYGGTGLGLAICKRLVEAMRSSIYVESKENEGSRFFFSLLMNAGEGGTVASQPQDDEEQIKLTPMHILVIEDNEMNRKVLQGFLSQDAHKVTMCESGEEAINLLERKGGDFDVIFTDIRLTGMDGLETTKTIRTLPDKKLANIPIVAVTGNVSPEDTDLYERIGMNGFISKPIVPEQIYEVLLSIQHGDNFEAEPEPEPATTPAETKPVETKPTEEKAAAPEQPSALAPKEQDKTKIENDLSDLELTETGLTFEDDMRADDEQESDVSPLQQYIQNAQSDEKPDDKPNDKQQNTTPPEQPPPTPAKKGNFDTAMLQSLYDSLGKEPFQELIDGFLDTADNIIDALVALKDSDDTNALYDRGHELKGMAANFGMTELSDISKAIEDAVKEGDLGTVKAEIEKLSDANQRAKSSLQSWIDSK